MRPAMFEEDVLLTIVEIGLATKFQTGVIFLTRNVYRSLMDTIVLQTSLQENAARFYIGEVKSSEKVLQQSTCGNISYR